MTEIMIETLSKKLNQELCRDKKGGSKSEISNA